MTPSARIIPLRGARGSCEECVVSVECLARDADQESGMPRQDIAVTPRVYQRGEHVFRCGDRFDSVYVVRSGAVKTYVICPSGQQQVIGFHVPGDVIGFDAIDRGEHMCHAEVLDTSSMCTIPFAKLCRLCSRSQSTQHRLLRLMSRSVQRDQALLLMLGQKSAEQRIAAFLLDTADSHARQGFSASEFHLLMTRADIGSYLALAVETVSRVLTRLQTNGTLEVQRNRIRIKDRAALLELAEADHEDSRPAAFRSAAH